MISSSAALRYHEATKYTPESIRALPQADEAARVPPFKEFHSERAVDLISYLPEQLFPAAAEEIAKSGGDPASELARLSRVLYFTYGATARRVWPGGHQIFRAAPSAGGMYPVEVYVVTRGLAGVPDGLHDYYVPNHQLVPIFDGDFLGDLARACFGVFDTEAVRSAVVLTSVYARSVWRYHERAYRRILLDAGHVMGNLALYSDHEGFDATPLACFNDDDVNGMFFLEPDQEHVHLVVPLVDRDSGPHGVELSWREGSGPPVESGSRGQLFLDCHEAGALDHTAPLVARLPLPECAAADERVTLDPDSPVPAGELSQSILRRRSTRAFSGANLSRRQLESILAAGYRDVRAQIEGAARSPTVQLPELLRTHVIILAVDEVEPGIYELDVRTGALLRRRAGDFSESVFAFALGQDVASGASAVVVHSADLPNAVAHYGDRAYRALHIDAGVVGHRMNIAAVQNDVGVSGVGGFLDEQVNETVGLPSGDGILYVTVLGVAKSE